MNKSLLGALLLSCGVMVTAQAKTVTLFFSKATPKTEIWGDFKGDEIDTYQFHARAGQVLQIEDKSHDPAVQYVVKDVSMPGERYIKLPETKQYELIVSQTRNDANQKPNLVHKYSAIVMMDTVDSYRTTPKAEQQMDYICNGGQPLTVRYQMRGSIPIYATVQWDDHVETLAFSRKYTRDDFIAFDNYDYLLGVTVLKKGNFQYSKVNSLLSFQKDTRGQEVFSECIPAIKQGNSMFERTVDHIRNGKSLSRPY